MDMDLWEWCANAVDEYVEVILYNLDKEKEVFRGPLVEGAHKFPLAIATSFEIQNGVLMLNITNEN